MTSSRPPRLSRPAFRPKAHRMPQDGAKVYSTPKCSLPFNTRMCRISPGFVSCLSSAAHALGTWEKVIAIVQVHRHVVDVVRRPGSAELAAPAYDLCAEAFERNRLSRLAHVDAGAVAEVAPRLVERPAAIRVRAVRGRQHPRHATHHQYRSKAGDPPIHYTHSLRPVSSSSARHTIGL